MNWSSSIIIFVFLSLSCKQDKGDLDRDFNCVYLVEASELKGTLDKKGLKVLDLSKRETYNKEHIAGAIHVSRSDIEDVSQPYRGIKASKPQIEDLFSQLGIENDDTIILYDDNGLCDSSRLWWILQNYNFKNV